MFSNPSITLKNTIVVAQSEAYQMGHISVSPEHFILALASGKDEIAQMLREERVNPDGLRRKIWKDSVSFERSILDIEFDVKARILMKVASELVDWNTLSEVTTAHVLKALLLEHAMCSVVEILKSINVDIERLRRRTEIILKLLDRPVRTESTPITPDMNIADPATSVIPADVAPIALPDVSATNKSTLSVVDVFDNDSIIVIATAQTIATARGHCFIRPDHLLFAFVKLTLWRDYVTEIILHVRDEQAYSVDSITADFKHDSQLEFAGETKGILVVARELARFNSGELIEPMMILYAIARECSLGLFKESAHDDLREISQKLRQKVIDEFEKRNIALIKDATLNFPDPDLVPEQPEPESVCLVLTERMIRVLRFAKAEAMHSQQIVFAPHLVLAMIRESFFSEISFVANRELEIENLRAAVCQLDQILTRPIDAKMRPSVHRVSPSSRRLLLLAKDKARELRVPYVDLNHLALALLESEDWLRRLVENSEFTNVSVLIRRLKQCSLQQHHQLQSRLLSDPSSAGWPMTLDEIDNDIEPWLAPGPLPPAKTSIEEQLNSRSEIVLSYAVLESRKFGHSQISVETIMLGLLYETLGPNFDVFNLHGLDLEAARKIFASCCPRISERTAALRPLSRNASRIMARAWVFAELMKSTRISPEHILLAIAEASEGIASFVCDALMIDGYTLRADVIAAMHAPPTQSDPQPAD